MLSAGPNSAPAVRQFQFEWRWERAVTTFAFASNGCYEVTYKCVGIDDIACGTSDKGRWSWKRKDRILMVSDTLLPKSFVGNKAFSLSLTTPLSTEFNLSLLKEILNVMTNATFGVEELRLASRRSLDASDKSLDIELPVIRVRGQGTLGTRTDIQAMIAELTRMRAKPVRFTVCCDLKQEGERVLLKPEKSKEDTFGDFYRPCYFDVKTNDYPVFAKGKADHIHVNNWGAVTLKMPRERVHALLGEPSATLSRQQWDQTVRKSDNSLTILGALVLSSNMLCEFATVDIWPDPKDQHNDLRVYYSKTDNVLGKRPYIIEDKKKDRLTPGGDHLTTPRQE